MNIPSEFHLAARLIDKGVDDMELVDQVRDEFRGKGKGAEARAALYDVLSDWRSKEAEAERTFERFRGARQALEDVLRESDPF